MARVVTPIDKVASLSKLQVEMSNNDDDNDDNLFPGPYDGG